MKDRYREFYETVGMCYPEDKMVYSTLSGLIRKKWILNKMKTMPIGNLLDCGCNVGRLSGEWRKGPVYGIDISFAVLKNGQMRYPKNNFIQGDIRRLEFLKANSVDNAIACEVIEHLEEPIIFLQGLYRTLRRGGLVLLSTPNYSSYRPQFVSLGILRSFGVKHGTHGNRYLHTAYKPEELRRLIQQVGFKVVEIGSFEFELRGWLKPANVVQILFGQISEKYFSASKLNNLITHFFNCSEIATFSILETLSFSRFLAKLFREGRRSYCIAQK